MRYRIRWLLIQPSTTRQALFGFLLPCVLLRLASRLIHPAHSSSTLSSNPASPFSGDAPATESIETAHLHANPIPLSSPPYPFLTSCPPPMAGVRLLGALPSTCHFHPAFCCLPPGLVIQRNPTNPQENCIHMLLPVFS